MKNHNRLFAFLTGMLLAFDFTGMIAGRPIACTREPERRSDRENIAADWNNIGGDFRKAMQGLHE